MERLETIFGSLPLQKVGTFNLAKEKKVVDLYVAKLIRGKSTDSTIVMMFAEHKEANPVTSRMSDVAWDTFMVRSYPHQKAMLAAVRQINADTIASMRGVRVKAPKWGNIEDVVMAATRRTQDYTTYEAEALGFTVTGFPESGNQFGNDLENQVELIPLLTSFNFCVQKKA
jgi:hypothetical protein